MNTDEFFILAGVAKWVRRGFEAPISSVQFRSPAPNINVLGSYNGLLCRSDKAKTEVQLFYRGPKR